MPMRAVLALVLFTSPYASILKGFTKYYGNRNNGSDDV